MPLRNSATTSVICRVRFPIVRMSFNAVGGLLLLALCASAHAALTGLPQDLAQSVCNGADPNFDERNDIYAVGNYKYRIAQLLRENQFELLDCIADSVRSRKARFSGGAWRIHRVYSGLEEPKPGRRASEDDWNSHLARLEHWTRMRPDSITARVAWAKAYVGYAWFARGSGYSDTVSDSAWKVFRERLEKARTILEEASVLQSKCPEWYVAMQQIALGEGWDRTKTEALLHDATKFEPGYYYYYRMQANHLLSKWYGEDGDSARFAAQSADRIGGKQGDALYFLIASQISCGCGEDPEFDHFSWQRVQKGFDEVEKQYGQSMVNLNVFARMAVTKRDSAVAYHAFERIGNNWDEDTWHREADFRQGKEWAEAAQSSGTAHQ